MASCAVGHEARKERRQKEALAPGVEDPSEVAIVAASIRMRYLLQLGLAPEPIRLAVAGRGRRLALEAGTPSALALPPELARGDCRLAFLRKLAYGEVWVPRVRRSVSHQTVSIFDWDDTLLCTSYIDLVHEQGRGISRNVRSQLRSLGKAAAKLLELALQSGRTLIVTNAMDGWVESSAAEYLPELLPLIQRVQVISARRFYERRFPGQFAKWKRLVFHEVRTKLAPSTFVNWIVLGDSRYEINAAFSVRRAFSNTTVKAIKFKEEPSPMELLLQLHLVIRRFSEIVGCARSVCRRLYHGAKIAE